MKQNPDVYVVQEQMIWSAMQAAARNTVVQIFAQIGKFDWCEPYRIESEYEAFGSGFLIDDEGYLVTNAHVVENAKYIWIQIPVLGRKKLEARVVGICPDRDIALLKINENGIAFLRESLGSIPFLELGDSDGVQGSQAILVLGYPLGQRHLKSATGIVSGHECISSSTLLQVTAPINPGNSGGPVLNTTGQVVGIAVALAANAHNVGYAIPSNELKLILPDLYTKKFIRRPYLGLGFVSASDEKTSFLGNPLPGGFYIAQVFQGTLCARAGVLPGDMLYEFNGNRVDAYGEMFFDSTPHAISIYDAVSRLKEGDTIDLAVYRKGERKAFSIVIDDKPSFAIRKKFPAHEPVEYDTIAGLVVMELTLNHVDALMDECPALVRFTQPENRVNRVLIVTNIVPGSYAYEVDSLVVGTIISTVNEKPVSTLREWQQALEQSLKTGFITLVTDHDVLTVFSLKKVLESEVELSKAFEYPLSETAKKLHNNYVS